MTAASRKELATLATTLGGYVAEQIEPLRRDLRSIIERVADLQNENTQLRSRVGELERGGKRLQIVPNRPRSGAA